MHPFLVLLALIFVGNFSTIYLMRREGIRELKSWRTAVIGVFVIPVTAFIFLAVITNIMR
jgi:hypothetical protein